MKHYVAIILSIFTLQLSAQTFNREVFSVIDLDSPGLEEAKRYYNEKKTKPQKPC